MNTVTDLAITQLITARLGADLRTGGQTIDVQITDDEIILVGWCDSEEQRKVAETIARGTCGVHKVVNKIRVRRFAQAI